MLTAGKHLAGAQCKPCHADDRKHLAEAQWTPCHADDRKHLAV